MAAQWAWGDQRDTTPDLSFLLTERRDTPSEEPAAFDPAAKYDTSSLVDEFSPRRERTPTDEGGGGFFRGITGGTSMGLKSNLSTTGWTIQGLNDMAGGDPNNYAGAVGKWLGDIGKDDKLQVGDFRKIHDFQSFREYIGEMLGQGIGSMAGIAAAGVAGTVAAGPIGGLATAGAAAFDTNYGDLLSTLHGDERIQQALKDGTVTRQQLATWATTYGAGMGALDVAGIGALGKITGITKVLGKEAKGAVAKEVADGIIKRIGKGAASEGLTEGGQEILSEVARVRSGGDRDDWESSMRVLNSVIGGAIPGGTLGAFHFQKKPPEPPPGQLALPAPPAFPQLPSPSTPGDVNQSTPAAPPPAPPGVAPNEPGGTAPPPPGQPFGAAGANTRDDYRKDQRPRDRVDEQFDILRKRQEEMGISPDLQVEDAELSQEDKDRVEGIFDRYRNPPADRKQRATSTELAPYDADLHLAANAATSGVPAAQQPITLEQIQPGLPAPAEALPAPPAALPSPPAQLPPPAPQQATQPPEEPFQRTPMPPPRPDIPFQPLDRGREQPFGRTSGTIPNPLAPPIGRPPAAVSEGPAPAPRPAPQQVPEAAPTIEERFRPTETTARMEPSLAQVPDPSLRPIPGMVYARHRGRTFAVPLAEWQTAMRLSFARGRFNPSVLEGREIPAPPQGAEVIEPELMMRSGFQHEFVRREAKRQRPPGEYEYEEAGPRQPQRRLKPRVAEPVPQPPGPVPQRRTGLIGEGELGFVKEEPAEPRHGVSERPPEPPALKPQTPPTPARQHGRYTGTSEKILHAAVTTAADVRAAAMKAVDWHPDKGVQREAVDRAMAEARDKLPKFRKQMPKALVKRGIGVIARRANEIAEEIDAEEYAKRALTERVKDVESAKLQEAREKEPGSQAGKRKTTAEQPVHGDPIRGLSLFHLIERAQRTVERLGKSAPLEALIIARLAAERAPFAKTRSKKGFSYMKLQELNAKIEALRNQWADAEDAQMAAYKEEVAKQAPPEVMEKIEAEETEAQTEGQIKAQQARIFARTKDRNKTAKAAVDKHLGHDVFATFDMKAIAKGVKAAIKEVGSDSIPDAFKPETNPPWENFLVFARDELEGDATEFNYHDRIVNVAIAYTYLGNSTPAELRQFHAFVKSIRSKKEEMGGARAGSVEDIEARREKKEEAKEAGFESDERAARADDYTKETQAQVDPRATAQEKADAAAGRQRTGPKFSKKDYTYQMRGDEKVWKATELLNTTSFGNYGAFVDKFFRRVDKAIVTALKHLIGDTKVYILPHEVLARLGVADPNKPDLGIGGLYVPPTAYGQSIGQRGYIILPEWMMEKDQRGQLRRVLLHEMIHAATLQAYWSDYRGSRQILNTLFIEARKAARAKGLWTDRNDPKNRAPYGWSHPEEFITEGLTQYAFSKMLSELRMLPGDPNAVRLRDLKPGNFFPTAWAALRAAVSRILGTDVYGSKGMTYLDGLMSTFELQAQNPAAMRDAATKFGYDRPDEFHKPRSGVRMEEGTAARAEPEPVQSRTERASEAFGGERAAFWDTVRDAGQAFHEAVDSSGKFSTLRGLRNRLATTTMGLRRRAEDLGWKGTQFDDMFNHFLGKEHTTNLLRKKGMEVAAKLQRMMMNKTLRKFVDLAQDIMDEGTLANVDFRYDAAHPKNAWFATGEGYLRHRLAHADLRRRYNALPKDIRDMVNEIGTTYGAMQKDAIRESVKAILSAARLDVALQSIKEDVDSVATWAAQGGLDRIGTPFETARDTRINNHLTGNVPKKLKNAISVRRMQGFYIPLKRRGNYVITAMRDYQKAKWLPKGALSIDEDHFQFADSAAYESYIRNNQRTKRDRILNVSHNQKKNTYTIRVQNRYMSMHENQTIAERERKDLMAAGQWENVSTVEHARGGIEQNKHLLPQQVQSILAEMAKAGMTPAQLKNAEAAIIQSQVHLMQGNRMEHHNRIARQGVFGQSTREAVQAMRDYTFGYSNFVSGLRHNPDITTGIAWAENQLKQMQQDPRHMQLSEIVKEMKRRVESIDGYSHNALLHTVTTMTYAAQLLSLSHLTLQLIQTTTTFIDLSGKFGAIDAFKYMRQAYRDIGVWEITKGSWKDVGTASKDLYRAMRGGIGELNIQHTETIKARLKSPRDKAAFEAMEKISLIEANAGQEMDVARLGKGRFENSVNAVGNIVQAMTSGVEAMNRSVTMLATMRLYMDKEGLSQEEAIRKALNVTEETQGLYSAANSPTVFNSAAGRIALQFKKFALFTGNWLAKMIWHGFGGAAAVATGTPMTKMQREQLKTIAFTLLTMGMLSGGAGAVPWEIIGMPLMVIQMLLGYKKPRDPADAVQQGIAQVLNYLGASTEGARKAAEIAMHGLPRLLGADISDRMGYQSLVTFGQPRSFGVNDMGSWLWKSTAGPFGARAQDLMQWIGSEKSWTSMPFLPKIIKDLDKAYTGIDEGTFTKYNRRAIEPFDPWQGTLKAAGFSTAQEKRQYEPGGAARLKSEEQEAKNERGDLMGRWYKADLLRDAGARDEAWQEIQDWNEGRPRKERIDRGDLYKLRQKRKSDLRKEHRRFGEEAYQ